MTTLVRGVRCRQVPRVLGVLLACAVMAGCSGNGGDPVAESTSTTARTGSTGSTGSTEVSTTTGSVSTTSGTTPGTAPGKWTAEQQEVIAVDEASITAYEKAAETSDPNFPDLIARTGHPLLLKQQVELHDQRKAGIATRRPPNSVTHVEHISAVVTGDTATVISCSLNDLVIYRVADGSIINDEVGTARFETTLSKADGVWKVVDRLGISEYRNKPFDTCLAAR